MCRYQIAISHIDLPVDSSARRQTMVAGYSDLRRALLQIASSSEREWEKRGGLSYNWAYDVLKAEWLGRHLPLDADQIEIPLPERTRGLFLLPPTPNAMACLLAVKWKFVAPPDGVQGPPKHENESYIPRGVFRVFLIPPETARSRIPTVVRFDEREDNTSWCFAHAQICDTMKPYETHFRAPACWVSAELPRIPLAATHGPAPVLLCLLASLYGADSLLLKRVLRVFLNDKCSRKVAKALGCPK